MVKTAVLFSGQGAQKPGMGKSLHDGNAAAKEIFERAATVLPNIKELCFDATAEELAKTENTQPCTFTVDVAAFKALEASVKTDCTAMAGFSLGEYAAVAAAGVIPFEAALSTVMKRAAWMSECAVKNPGGMAAVMGKSTEELQGIIDSVRSDGLLIMANYNCPGQTVVSGDEKNLSAFLAYCRENRIKAVKLAVSGAFHSCAMREVEQNLASEFESMDFAVPNVTLYSNVTGRPYDTANMKALLASQAASPVRFEDTIRALACDKERVLIECGEGKVLAGLVKRTDKELKVLNVYDMDSLASAIDELK